MSWNARDYAGETDASRYREYLDEMDELRARREAQEREELIACDLADSVEASEIAEPIATAVGGWLRAVTAEYRRAA